MRTKFVVFTLLALALVLSACVPSKINQGSQPIAIQPPTPIQPWPSTINQSAQPTVRTLNVNGVGQIFLTPDIAYIYIGVHTEAQTASEAVNTNKTQTNAVIDAITKAGVDKNDIRTTNFSIYPSQQYAPEGQQTGTIYMVDNTVYVTVRDLDKLGSLLDDVISAGANTINSIQFDVADKTQALKDARVKAIEDAKTQAQELADAAGLSLGAIQNISFYDSSPYPMYEGKGGGGGGMAANVAVPIQPGQLTVAVTVNVNYEIK